MSSIEIRGEAPCLRSQPPIHSGALMDPYSDARKPLREAATLPADAFTSATLYEREVERLFLREWLCAGRSDQVPDAGDYFTLDLLGDKLVVVRGKDTEIRALSRICRHRGAELATGSGNARSFQCPYHSWTYQLDGKLLGAPHMEGVQGFDRANCRLPRLRCEIWEGWIFVNFDADAAPLGPRLAPLSKLLSNYRMSEMIAVETARFDSPYNWKVLTDNFMEAYHHIAIHRDTFEPIFPGAASFAPDNEGPYAVLNMPARSGADGAENVISPLPKLGELDAEEEARLVAVSVFPFHLFVPAGDLLTWYQILPEGVDQFTLKIFSCFPKQTLDDTGHRETVEGVQAFTRHVHHEDIAACEATWAGLMSRSFSSGRLSMLEKPIWQFNQWWTERMMGED